MPTWQEFLTGFSLKELFLTLFVAFVIFSAREKPWKGRHKK